MPLPHPKVYYKILTKIVSFTVQVHTVAKTKIFISVKLNLPLPPSVTSVLLQNNENNYPLIKNYSIHTLLL